MIYEYNEEVVNRSNDFNDKRNFVGYILPDGSVFRCKDHNVSNVDSFLKMYLELLDANYDKKEELIDVETDNKLAKIILKYLKNATYEQIHALLEFTKKENITIKDLLVSLFGCHLVTRLKKEILTSEINHQCFYNYLLHDFKIVIIDKLVYDDNTKKYHYIKAKERNDYLYDEIEKIRKEVNENELDLFHKTI